MKQVLENRDIHRRYKSSLECTFTGWIKIKKHFDIRESEYVWKPNLHPALEEKMAFLAERNPYQSLHIVQQCFCPVSSLINQMSSICPSIHIMAQLRVFYITLTLGNSMWLSEITIVSCSYKKMNKTKHLGFS